VLNIGRDEPALMGRFGRLRKKRCDEARLRASSGRRDRPTAKFRDECMGIVIPAKAGISVIFVPLATRSEGPVRFQLSLE
jgi:hypothetical protein